MDDRSSFRKKWLFIVIWLAILIIGYLYITSKIEGFWDNPWNLIIDIAIFLLTLGLWMAFFAQFVLPVRTIEDRLKVFDRLLRHLTGSHGPALFIENGLIKEHSGERLKKGSGVVWLDSASAAVTRTAVSIRKIIGPGVHFTEGYEYIEKTGTLDLHVQTQKLGPDAGDKPFAEKTESQTDVQYKEIQNRRKQVSALTRDGIEVVPDISVTFRVNTGFPAVGAPGSRFGYRTGTTSTARNLEKLDQEVIKKAILGEGINPNVDPEKADHRVAWNRLPAILAVDVWREYAAKFTLDEFFRTDQVVPQPASTAPQPTDEETVFLHQPVIAHPNGKQSKGLYAGMLHEINRVMAGVIASLEQESTGDSKVSHSPFTPQPEATREPVNKTALQVINDMVKARLTQPTVDPLSDTGKRLGGLPEESKEYALLEKRGLKVKSVSISNIRLNPKLEDQLIQQWSANWLKNAKDESEQLDRKRNVIETSSQEQAQLDYAKLISREVDDTARKRKTEVKDLLKALLLRSRAIIRSGEHSDQLRRRMTNELQEIENIMQWMEQDGK